MCSESSHASGKVFAVGFNKTGTSSLHALFRSLGLRSYHGEKWRASKDLEFFSRFDCFSDGIPSDLAFLDRTFTAARFILQVRDLDNWVYSRLEHIERKRALGIYSLDPSWQGTENAVRSWILQRNRHHLAVLSHFAERPDDLLVVNYIRDSFSVERICHFLGCETVRSRPHRNMNPRKEVDESHTRIFNAAADSLGLVEPEYSYDIYCPTLLGGKVIGKFPPDTGAKLPSDLERTSITNS